MKTIKSREIRWIRGLQYRKTSFSCSFGKPLDIDIEGYACVPFKKRPCLVIGQRRGRPNEYVVVEITSKTRDDDGIERLLIGKIVSANKNSFHYDVFEIYHESYFIGRGKKLLDSDAFEAIMNLVHTRGLFDLPEKDLTTGREPNAASFEQSYEMQLYETK